MLIKMLETRRGSPDGYSVLKYEKGMIYDMPDALAKSFLRAGWCYNVEPDDEPTARWDAADVLYQALKPPTREQLERILRPVATNPATRSDL